VSGRQLALVERLIDARHLPISRGTVRALGAPPATQVLGFDRVKGMLLGLAIGDALGNTSEGLPPTQRQQSYGEITHYLPNDRAGGRRVGLPSDDSQLAFWTLDVLLEHGRVVPEKLIERFACRQDEIYGIGRTLPTVLKEWRSGRPWYEAAQPSARNGAVMRIAPVILPYLASGDADLLADAILAGAVTHKHQSSIAACVALVGILRDVLGRERPPDPSWWIDAYVKRARDLEGEPDLVGRSPNLCYRGPVWRFIDTEVRRMLGTGASTRHASDHWHSGASLLETIPSVVYILALHAAEGPKAAIVRAVNDTWDNDTVAAIVGAVVGALHGGSKLPASWVSDLLGRTGTSCSRSRSSSSSHPG